MAELAGIADGFGIALRRPLRPSPSRHPARHRQRRRARSRRLFGAWAAAAAPKVRCSPRTATSPAPISACRRSSATRARISATGAMLCVGSLGSPGAYSSGMNAAGLLLADTQIGARTSPRRLAALFPDEPPARRPARPSPRRSRSSAPCRMPAAARSSSPMPAGGCRGDRARRHARSPSSAARIARRTNHFVSTELDHETLEPENDRISSTSLKRFAYLDRVLPAHRLDSR